MTTKSRIERHTCHATGCNTRVPPAMFMCKPHWSMLPRATRNAVWLAYSVGQEMRMDPSDEYMQVATDAIEWLAAKEASTE